MKVGQLEEKSSMVSWIGSVGWVGGAVVWYWEVWMVGGGGIVGVGVVVEGVLGG